MADTSYQVASGKRMYAGATKTPHAALLATIDAAPENSWIKISGANAYQDVWPHVDFRTIIRGGPHAPRKIIISLSSVVWNDDALEFYLFGGGHASSNGNEVYKFDAISGLWSLAFQATDVQPHIKDDTSAVGEEPISGALSAPQSCHTYAASCWLSVLKRAAWFGGACDPSGGPWVAAGPDRTLGPFLLDPSLMGKNYVSATYGSNVKHSGTTSDGVNLTGAQAWDCRDWRLDHTDKAQAGYTDSGKVINGWAQATVEGGKDVVYFASQSGGSAALNMFRVQFNDYDYRNDTVTKLGTVWTGNSNTRQGGAYDPVRNIAFFLHDKLFTDAAPFVTMWDLDTAGASNHDVEVPGSAVTGAGVAPYRAESLDTHTLPNTNVLSGNNNGIMYDPKRDVFPIWNRGGKVFLLKPPTDKTNITTAGWVMDLVGSDALSPRPQTFQEYVPDQNRYDIGVCGKWNYSVKLDCYVALQDALDGHVWLFKPAGWSVPE